MNANQIYLFEAPEEKSYPGANGVKLPYWEQDGKIIRIALSDRLILPVTNQKGGHIYTFVPGYGRLEKRGKNAKTSFLSHAATLRRTLELNESIAGHGQSIVGHGQSIARDVEEQGKLLRGAMAKSLELEVENTRLGGENARLREQLAAAQAQAASSAGSSQDPQPRIRNQSINLRAVRWAYAQEDLHSTAKAVLLTLAMHADYAGYSWPGVKRIASTWGMDPGTVRRQIEVLLVRRLLHPTKKRCGATGQVKVYLLPKNAYERGGKCPPFKNEESEAKAGDKGGIRGGKSAPNKEEGIRNPAEKKASGDSVPSLSDGPLAGDLSVFSSLSSQKAERQEPAWFDEIRGMYPGTTVNNDLKTNRRMGTEEEETIYARLGTKYT